jgi:hypothetical protein
MSGFTHRLAVGLVLAAGLIGCSSSDKPSGSSGPPTSTDALQQVADMIRDYASANGRPPAKAADLAGMKNLYNIGYQAVESGDVVVIWGAGVAGEGGGGSESVVAYEKKVPDSGGAVLLENGTVKQMTAAEFTAAPKAKKK